MVGRNVPWRQLLQGVNFSHRLETTLKKLPSGFPFEIGLNVWSVLFRVNRCRDVHVASSQGDQICLRQHCPKRSPTRISSNLIHGMTTFWEKNSLKLRYLRNFHEKCRSKNWPNFENSTNLVTLLLVHRHTTTETKCSMIRKVHDIFVSNFGPRLFSLPVKTCFLSAKEKKSARLRACM
jgi:hypothetical protein